MASAGPVRLIEVRGIVQGVGFRPFVYRLARSLGVRGDVRNAGGTVLIRAAGSAGALDELARRLVAEAPPHSDVVDVAVTALEPDGDAFTAFTVLPSTAARGPRELPPDLATCEDCLRELFDPADRRYRYPFINCTNCGPRATIMESLPYDRERTTMRGFAMCRDCAAEYADPADRRFHAEPVACPCCGPRLRWAELTGEDALTGAVATLAAGGLAAVKGIGGYQLVCDATDAAAVERLRAVKGREAKPFAVMVPDVEAAGALARLTPADLDTLTSAAAPIVLAPVLPNGPLAPDNGAGMPDVGLFLPYSPLHHLLLRELARSLVVTSGNRADGPMIIDDARASAEFGAATDGVLCHDRLIMSRYDDSVVRTVAGRPMTVRRGRGLAPVRLPAPAGRTVLGVGAQLKNTFTIASGGHAIIGPHIGDLEDAETLDAFEESLGRLCRLLAAEPVCAAHDLHPGYLSTAYAARWERRVPVQHHHAHVVATAAEHDVRGPFLGVAYDGLGLGDDGTFWGGEVLLATYEGYRRLGRFGYAPMPGGAAAVRRPARMALGHLFGGEDLGSAPPEAPGLLARLPGREVEIVRRMVDRGVHVPRASSAGRLFDAAAALLGVCDVNRFEGEAAMRLEAAADGSMAALAWRLVRRDGLWVYDSAATLSDIVRARADGEPVGRVAAGFHAAVAAVTVALCERAADGTGVSEVCLSGGVFQNRRLTEAVLAGLAAAGFRAYVGERVPVGDGGISYGQAVVATARTAGR